MRAGELVLDAAVGEGAVKPDPVRDAKLLGKAAQHIEQRSVADDRVAPVDGWPCCLQRGGGAQRKGNALLFDEAAD